MTVLLGVNYRVTFDNRKNILRIYEGQIMAEIGKGKAPKNIKELKKFNHYFGDGYLVVHNKDLRVVFDGLSVKIRVLNRLGDFSFFRFFALFSPFPNIRLNSPRFELFFQKFRPFA